ncbi:MAG: flagellar basal body P-ring formation chaperone FlgA [Thermoguttaceae bacterium]
MEFRTLPLFLVVFLVTVAAPLPAAEIELRAAGQVQGTVVTLGDVADVLTADRRQAEALAAVELFPASAVGRSRILRVQEIQEILAARQINLGEHRFSGSNQVVVTVAAAAVEPVQRPVSPAAIKQAERLVTDAVVRYLKDHAGADGSWNATVKVDERQVRAVLESRKISVRGGRAPWVGNQRFELTLDSRNEPATFPVEARIATLPPVVVAVAILPKGAIIRSTDVQLVAADANDTAGAALHSIDDVVGKETKRAISPGMPIPGELIRPQILVRRGELVRVLVRSAGIRIRAEALAKEDGGLGDLIALESLPGRKIYAARVSGEQEAEVYARAVKAEAGR